MLAIKKHIEEAVSKAMVEIEKKVLAMSKEAVIKNRQIMQDHLDKYDAQFDECVRKQVEKVLQERKG